MKYALLLYEDEQPYGPGKSGPVLQEMMGKHMAFVQELGPARLGGAGLKAASSATTIRTAGGTRTIHDGPFAETKEQLGGVMVLEANDLNHAIQLMSKLPCMRVGGCLEIRPINEELSSPDALKSAAAGASMD
jgi:hypothetical protein